MAKQYPQTTPEGTRVRLATILLKNLLHPTGRSETTSRVLRNRGATGGLVSDGNADILELLSVTELSVSPAMKECSMSLQSARTRSGNAQTWPSQPTHTSYLRDELKENRVEC
jgi:hypothetical protein